MVGYLVSDEKKIQVLDTPGTLNRPNKMNEIEKYAWLAMKYAADEIIYIFDPTEQYPFDEQVKLYFRIKELGKKMVVYVSKCDLISREEKEEFVKKIVKKVGKVKIFDGYSLEKLKEFLLKIFLRF